MKFNIFEGFLLIISAFVGNFFVDSTSLPLTSYNLPGDIVLAGLFPLHYQAKRPDNYSYSHEPVALQCVRYNFLGSRWMQAMIFAIEEINNSSEFLPNIFLGFQIFDTCNTNSRAVRQAIHLVENLQSPSSLNASVVVGPTESAKSIVTSNILSAYDVPQISYASTSRILSNKNIYKTFFRTIPNDDEQTLAIVDLLLRYNWKWIGAVGGDDDYGRPGIAKLKDIARAHNICIEYTAYVSQSMPSNEMEVIAQEVRDFNATVFVLFISAAHLERFAEHLSRNNVSDKVWIASEAWATSDTIRRVDGDLFEGTLGIAARGGEIPGFHSHLQNVSPQTQPTNPFLLEFWQLAFNCSCEGCEGYNSSEKKYPPCSKMVNLTASSTASSAYLNEPGEELEKSYSVYLAVYALAHALDAIMKCEEGSGLLDNGSCPLIGSLKPWQLLPYLSKVNFTKPGQNESEQRFHFDESGDPQASYKLINWQSVKNGNETEIEFVDVAHYSLSTSPRWTMQDNQVLFKRSKEKEAPISECSGTCPAGSYQRPLRSSCCFQCTLCPVNQYSTAADSRACMECALYERSIANRTGCVPKLREYVRWNDGFGVTFCVLVAIGVGITLFTAGVFFKHRETALVKATNFQLSFLFFTAITFCFLTPLLYIAEPQDWSCRARMVSFSLSFTVSIAAILVKTLRVLTAFEAKIPVRDNKKTRWLGEHLQVLVAFLVSLIQACLCIAWLLVDPAVRDLHPSLGSADTLVVECTPGNTVLLFSIYGYICLLAIIAFVFAFRARKLPQNFNEAKFITFSMLIFFIVWCSFIPAYLTTKGMLTTVVYCIAVFASTFSFLSCIFIPKLYIILITPERNTKLEVRVCTTQHAIKSTRRATIRRKVSMDNASSSHDHQMSMDLDFMKGFNYNINNNNKNSPHSVSNKNKRKCDEKSENVLEASSESTNDIDASVGTITITITDSDVESITPSFHRRMSSLDEKKSNNLTSTEVANVQRVS